MLKCRTGGNIYCAAVFFYKGTDVAIVGGGDTACEEATYLAKICRKVYMIVRKNHLKASMQERVFNTENIEVIWEHETKEILGDKVVNGVLLSNVITGEETKLDIEGFFVAIGPMKYKGINYASYFNYKNVKEEVGKVIESLSQKSWKVELEMECSMCGLTNGHKMSCEPSLRTYKPKLTNNKIKILKLLK